MDDPPRGVGIAPHIDAVRAVPVARPASDEVAAFAMQPQRAAGAAGAEWDLLDRAVLAMQARDWPAVIVPISAASLGAPSCAYRVRDLAERQAVDPRRIWLHVESARAVLHAPGVVSALAIRHHVGCTIHGADALDVRASIPDLVDAGVSFAWLEQATGSSAAGDLAALIGGRSLVRRARTHGLVVIGPAELGCHLMPPATR